MKAIFKCTVALVVSLVPFYQSSPHNLVVKPFEETQRWAQVDTKVWVRDYIVWAEGGFYDFEDDYGGPTNKGITWETFKHQCKYLNLEPTQENFTNFGDEIWLKVFENFWSLAYCDSVKYAPLKASLMDFAWGSGHFRSTQYIQKCLNLQGFNLKVDGVLGPQTRKALKACDAPKLTRDIALTRRQIADNCKKYSKGLHNRLDVFEKAVLSDFLEPYPVGHALHIGILHEAASNKTNLLFGSEQHIRILDSKPTG